MENISETFCVRDRIPSLEECDELMAKYSMLPNIVAHSRTSNARIPGDNRQSQERCIHKRGFGYSGGTSS